MDFSQRLGKTIERTLPKVGPEARAQLAALVQPQALAIMAVILAAWVGSHAVGLGELHAEGAAAEHDEVLDPLAHVEDRLVGEIRHLVETWDRRDARS